MSRDKGLDLPWQTVDPRSIVIGKRSYEVQRLTPVGVRQSPVITENATRRQFSVELPPRPELPPTRLAIPNLPIAGLDELYSTMVDKAAAIYLIKQGLANASLQEKVVALTPNWGALHKHAETLVAPILQQAEDFARLGIHGVRTHRGELNFHEINVDTGVVRVELDGSCLSCALTNQTVTNGMRNIADALRIGWITQINGGRRAVDASTDAGRTALAHSAQLGAGVHGYSLDTSLGISVFGPQ